MNNTVEACRRAIEAGEVWIRLDLSAAIGDADKIFDEAIALCREADVILTLVDDIDRVESRRVHGVHLSEYDENRLRSTRERLGANAIIGVAVSRLNDADEMAETTYLEQMFSTLRRLDIDYFSYDGDDYLVE